MSRDNLETTGDESGSYVWGEALFGLVLVPRRKSYIGYNVNRALDILAYPATKT